MSHTIVNLTPHPITLRSPQGEDVVVPPSGTIARVSATPGALKDEGLPVPVAGPTIYGEVVGLPPPLEGCYYIVSNLVLAALRGSRPDVLAPGTGPGDNPIRDEGGRVIAVTRLVRGGA
jgi:hypothetical protein